MKKTIFFLILTATHVFPMFRHVAMRRPEPSRNTSMGRSTEQKSKISAIVFSLPKRSFHEQGIYKQLYRKVVADKKELDRMKSETDSAQNRVYTCANEGCTLNCVELKKSTCWDTFKKCKKREDESDAKYRLLYKEWREVANHANVNDVEWRKIMDRLNRIERSMDKQEGFVCNYQNKEKVNPFSYLYDDHCLTD